MVLLLGHFNVLFILPHDHFVHFQQRLVLLTYRHAFVPLLTKQRLLQVFWYVILLKLDIFLPLLGAVVRIAPIVVEIAGVKGLLLHLGVLPRYLFKDLHALLVYIEGLFVVFKHSFVLLEALEVPIFPLLLQIVL